MQRRISLTAEPTWFSFTVKLFICSEMVLGYFIFIDIKISLGMVSGYSISLRIQNPQILGAQPLVYQKGTELIFFNKIQNFYIQKTNLNLNCFRMLKTFPSSFQATKDKTHLILPSRTFYNFRKLLCYLPYKITDSLFFKFKLQ